MSTWKMNQRFTKNPIDQRMLDAKIINEEYKIWRKVVPLLYETIQVHKLPESPSNIFKWLPKGISQSNNNNSVSAKFLISSHDAHNNNKNNKISICSIELPETLSNSYCSEDPILVPQEHSMPHKSKFQVVQSFEHEDEVKLTEVNENDPKFFASFQISGNIAIYNMENHDQTSKYSILKLISHSSLGKSLKWRPNQSNHLLSGSSDSIILWDLNKQAHNNNTVDPFHIYPDNDTLSLSWNKLLPHVFAAATNPRDIKIFDVRTNHDAVYHVTNTHRAALNSIEFHPASSSMFATGSDDRTISLWDMRYITRPFRQLFGNVSAVTKLQFDSDQNDILVSLDRSRRMYFWDLNEIQAGDFDEEIYLNGLQKDPDLEDPCLRFIHGGHVGNINDFDVSRDMFNVYGSVGDDQLIEIWKPFFVKSDEEEVEEEEEEKTEEIKPDQEKVSKEAAEIPADGNFKQVEEIDLKKADDAGEVQTAIPAPKDDDSSLGSKETVVEESNKEDGKDIQMKDGESKPDVLMSSNTED